MSRSVNTANRDAFYNAVEKMYGIRDTITRQEIKKLRAKYPKIAKPHWLLNDPDYRVGRGVYSMSRTVPKGIKSAKPSAAPRAVAANNIVATVPTVPAAMTPVVTQSPQVDVGAHMPTELVNAEAVTIPAQAQHVVELDLIPLADPNYVPFGHYKDIVEILKSRMFYPVYITGLSGNGKTMMVEQACAKMRRELVRANITEETDEDDLIGGFRLIAGNTVWQNGPVITAMERGAVLLLDEVDLGGNRLLCLQPVLEGRPVFVKKINRVITPAPGFTVMATANTKGQGSADGRFIGTRIQNEAFLERFSMTYEQEYPEPKAEKKILDKLMASHGIPADDTFTKNLADWADITRKTFIEGGLPDLISTRRLVHIMNAYFIFSDKAKAIQLCLNRFDVESKNSLYDLYAALDVTVKPSEYKPRSDEDFDDAVSSDMPIPAAVAQPATITPVPASTNPPLRTGASYTPKSLSTELDDLIKSKIGDDLF